MFEEEDICMVLLRNKRLAPVPGEGALSELSAIVSRFILFGVGTFASLGQGKILFGQQRVG
jgi:hypothetical protein